MSVVDPLKASLDSPAQVLNLLQGWVEAGWLRRLDRVFVEFLHREAPRAEPRLLLAAGLASHQLGRGHVCLDLEQLLARPDDSLSLPPEGLFGGPAPRLPSELLAGQRLEDWLAALLCPELVADGPGETPLVREGSRLYLRRYWQYEQDIARALGERLARDEEILTRLPEAELRDWLQRLFAADPRPPSGVNWQRIACALAARSAFSIITGGPGTGKTTTVLRLLAILQALARAGGKPQGLRIRLAAPTGKAAARLNESIAGAVARLPLGDDQQGEALRALIPTEVSTVHRLLGSRPDSRHFRHDAERPLPLDVLVVDEASMVDVELMAALLQALPTPARLILLGDKDQLASVEAGAVLGDLCRRAEGGHYRPETVRWLAGISDEPVPAEYLSEQGGALDQHIVMLRDSHRFGPDSGIAALAARVRAGDAAAVNDFWQRGPHDDVSWRRPAEPEEAALAEWLVEGDPAAGSPGYGDYLRLMHSRQPGKSADAQARDDWARAVLGAYGGFQLLCALRGGAWGVEAMNRRIRTMLQSRGLISGEGQWYAGRPVMVTRNDYGLGLMNGDVGIALRLPGEESGPGGRLRVAFLSGDGSDRVRWVLPSRLGQLETCFAMTVHKSQGSEFRHAALMLPAHGNPVLSRELVYTGITRASRWFTLVASKPEVLHEAVRRRVRRVSGLRALGDAT
ncbi:exodeoxyribonuclease V subunit alpha [Alkalilimnicola sp. S0819]|uniref:exodeoxyribonuclease V subunit alpha n=1 Tax=Alkalilimnicola sp. S0819 TaxID=2613922 RepID=UPI001262599E|nr:exodeoxyribonuclease V subunit alpha [Alkalilimnicola sp. S0819]KAB7627776.1 exodeoxyribonuclease V subunit alpha [Alkalilimnicola sp. S0819]MPQ15402.1 exodeoxyribonuclease V subunit alpha [Alkalilimnicola sp. S0819]